ncbi:MAG TPA: FAD-dependent oxidoreductase [Clostridia bacterium]|nr:FAD-dependent oxidoreductase [Clostridia bacterium]
MIRMLKMRFLMMLLGAIIRITPAAELPQAECDVLVVGGGSAGICAAIQSGRAGAKTILVERAHQVGGNTTTGGVNFPGLFHAWGQQVIGGIGWELVEETTKLGGGTLPDFKKPTGGAHWNHQVRVNIPLFVALSEEALEKAGVTLQYHSAPITIQSQASGWRVLTVAAGDTRVILCKQLVDCTGNGAVADLLGLERMREEETQPGSFVYTLNLNTDISKLDAELLEARFRRALKAGVVQSADCRSGLMQYLKAGGDTANYIENADNSNADARTRTNIRGRQSMLRMFRFLKTLPGLENVTIGSMSPEVGVRETFRVKGEYIITQEDYTSARRWEDSICNAFYPVDIHTMGGVKPAHLQEGMVATVPLRALIPKGSVNLLVAGRCLSSDRLANSALRVQATCMATGQAAGGAAALAAKLGITPAKVPINELKALLKASNAILPQP